MQILTDPHSHRGKSRITAELQPSIFRLQSTAESAHQKATGKAYPEGALGKAGQSETEPTLPKGTAYKDDQPVPGRVAPEVHHEL